MRKFNLSLDDFAPYKRSGLYFESIEWCDKLIEKYPEIKINLFVTAAFCRLGEQPCYLTKNPEWVKKVNNLPKSNYSINFHGLYHRRTDGKHPNSNNDEFMYLRGEQANVVIDTMIKEFDKAGLKHKNVFRPPGWKISTSATKALTDRGFIIAGNQSYYDLHKDRVPGLRWVSYNWDLTKLCDLSGDIYAFGHTSSWTNNYMDETRFKLIDDVLSKELFEFAFIEELL